MKARETSGTAASVRLTFPMGGEDGPPLDRRFSVEPGLQHVEFPRQGAKPSKHVGGPLPAQRAWTFGG